MKLIAFIILFIITLSFNAQEDHWDEQVAELTNGCGVIEWFYPKGDNDLWGGIVSLCDYKVGIYNFHLSNENDEINITSVQEIIPAKYKSIKGFENLNLEFEHQIRNEIKSGQIEYSIVYTKNKTGVIYKYFTDKYIYEDANDLFDEIDSNEIFGSKIIVSNKKKWGVYDWYNKKFIVDCVYKSKELAIEKLNASNKSK